MTTNSAESLRDRRERLGVTRIQLAALADCSPSSLSNIEQGYVPKRSQVLDRASAALDRLEQEA